MTISIIIPIYNAEKSIGKTLQSILDQKYTHWELLLINDGSTDKSQAMCQQFVSKDNRIHLFQQKNQGVSAARNKGLSEATGKFIVFIDADDEVTDEYLLGLIEDYENHEQPDFVIQGYNKEFEDGHFEEETLTAIAKRYNAPLLSFFKGFNILKCGYPFSKLFRKEILINYNLSFNTEITFCEDLVFLLNYLHHCQSLLISNRTNYIYHHTPDSLSIKFHSFASEYCSFIAITETYKSLLIQNGMEAPEATQFIFDSYDLPITRPLASVVFVEQVSLTEKSKIVREMDQYYFDMLKYFFKHAKKYQFVSLFCNKHCWYLVGFLLYLRYYVRPKVKQLLRKLK